jgi:hypothetical protein
VSYIPGSALEVQMDRFKGDPRWERVSDRNARAARDCIASHADSKGWLLQLAGDAVGHIQFRTRRGERPYPFSLCLYPNTTTFYVRRPTDTELQALPREFKGAHLNPAGEVKIPVPDKRVAERVASRFFN